MQLLFKYIATLAGLYTILCFIRVLLTWMPGMGYGGLVGMLARVCDPYLNFFRRLRFLRFGALDFSPVAALAVLGAVSNFANTAMAGGGVLSLGRILVWVVGAAWSVVSSLLGILLILVVIRLVAHLAAPRSTFSLWYSLDRTLAPFTSALRRGLPFLRSYGWQLAGMGAAIMLLQAGGGLVVGLLTAMLRGLPF
jgi:YggT family protein